MENLPGNFPASLSAALFPHLSHGCHWLATPRIDTALKAELRDTAFQRWLACSSNREIAKEVGYSEAAISEFVDSLQNVRNGSRAVSDVSSENLTLTPEAFQEFDEDPEEDTNSLGVYTLDKRLLIKAQHLARGIYKIIRD